MLGWFDETIINRVEHTKSFGNRGMVYQWGGNAREEESQRIEGEVIMVEIATDCGDAS